MKILSSQMRKGNNVLTNIFNAAKTGCSELIDLYGNTLLRRRLLICHFTFFMSSLTYYVIGNISANNLRTSLTFFILQALNGDNFLANQYFYVAVTGLTEVPSYIVPCIMFKWMGRKRVSLILFFLAGCALLSILAIPLSNQIAILLSVHTLTVSTNRLQITQTQSSLSLYSAECASVLFSLLLFYIQLSYFQRPSEVQLLEQVLQWLTLDQFLHLT